MAKEDKELLLEAWKQVIDTQMHFNDLGLRIRNFAFLLTGAFIALGGYAIREGGSIAIPIVGWEISIASAIIFSSILPLLGVYFMDRQWYHPLLIGSVIEGSRIEKALREHGIPVSLGSEISWQSGSLNFTLGEKKLFTVDEKERYESENNTNCNHRWEKVKDKYALMEGNFPLKSFRSHNKMMAFYLLLIGAMAILGYCIHKPQLKEAVSSKMQVTNSTAVL